MAVFGAVPAISLNVNVTDAVWDPTSGNFFVGVGANDAKYPSTVLLVNPNTGQVGDSIPVGDAPDRVAVSADGQYLYVGIDAKAVVRRFHLPSHTPDFDITVGAAQIAGGYGAAPIAIAVFPAQPASILVANGSTLAVYDGMTARAGTAPFSFPYYSVGSIYARADNGAFYAYANGVISTVAIKAAGVSIAASVAALPVEEARVKWSGRFATDDWGYVFNLDTSTLLGRLAMPSGVRSISVADPSGTTVLAIPTTNSPSFLGRYSLTNFEPTETVSLPDLIVGSNTAVLDTWGSGGVAVVDTGGIVFVQTASLAPVIVPPVSPTTDSAGAIHLKLSAGGVVFDSQRNLIWATIGGAAGTFGNSVIGIDPSSGSVKTTIYAGSEPGPVAISDDQSRIFVGLAGAPAIVPVNLSTQLAEPPYPVPTSSADYNAAGLWVPTALASVPGEPQSVVAVDSPSYLTTTYRRNVAVYDPTGPRRDTFNKTVDTLINGDAANAYFVENESTSDFSLYRLLVSSTGIALGTQLNSIGGYFYGTLAYANSALFSDVGAEWTTDTNRILASFAAFGTPVPLSDLNQVIYVSAPADAVDIVAFDLSTFRPVSTLFHTGNRLLLSRPGFRGDPGWKFPRLSHAAGACHRSVELAAAGHVFVRDAADRRPRRAEKLNSGIRDRRSARQFKSRRLNPKHGVQLRKLDRRDQPFDRRRGRANLCGQRAFAARDFARWRLRLHLPLRNRHHGARESSDRSA